jgi:hypothetical protein
MEIHNSQIRVTATETDGLVSHEISTAAGVVVARCLDTGWTSVRRDNDRLILEGETGVGHARLTLTVPEREAWVHAEFEATVTGKLSKLGVFYEFCQRDLNFAFAPHIRPNDGHTVSQWGMKTPAAIVQSGTTTMALILDVTRVTEQSRRLPIAIEMEADPLVRATPLLGMCVNVVEPVDLNYFREAPEQAVDLDRETVRISYYIWVSDSSKPGHGYREAARLLWQMMGQERIRKTVAPQIASFNYYAKVGLTYAFDKLWYEFEAETGPAGGVLNGIVYPNDIWFQSLFDHMRSAIGLYGFGYPERGRRIKNLALSAPQHPTGLYKTIFRPSVKQARREHDWETSSHWMLSRGVESKMRSVRKQNLVKLLDWENLYHTVDCSWNAYWMLRWHTEVEADDRLIDLASRYADFLVQRQTSSGAIPSFFRPDGPEVTPDPLLSHNVGTAASGALLASLHAITGKRSYLDAARRAARFVEAEILPNRQWQDYEVVFDSGAKPLGFFDRHTQQYCQATQGMVWTVAMYHALYRATGEQPYLDRAGEVVDYLSLFQQLWDPPFLSVRTFGGFPVGNSHPSWNDARTPLLATAFADHFEFVPDPLYLERAIAALRASFALMFMPENEAVSAIFAAGPHGHADEGYAGRGRDEQFTGLSFDFPVGAALSSIALVKRRLGDVYVDFANGFGLGIDGCLVPVVRIEPDAIHLVVEHTVPVSSGETQRLVVERAPAGKTSLFVNGSCLGMFTGEQLRAGVSITAEDAHA